MDASYAGIFRFRVRQMNASYDWKFTVETNQVHVLKFKRWCLLTYEYAGRKLMNGIVHCEGVRGHAFT